MAIIFIVLFAVVFGTILLCVALASSYFKKKQKHQIRSMLQNAEAVPGGSRTTTMWLKPANVEDGLARLLKKFQFVARLDLTIEQAGMNFTASKLLAISSMCFAVAFLVGLK